MKVLYKKLVRDNIPDICIANNQKPKYKVLNDNEYKTALNKKLKEETKEYIKSNDIEELADILEVVEAIAVAQGSTFEDVLKIKETKAKKNGRFAMKYYLESVRK
ncbi:MAG: phosphoribosyl-ATP pyrophosphohydrolase [Eubacterium sp.]